MTWLAILWVLSVPVPGPGKAWLSGWVRSRNGRPLAGAWVRLQRGAEYWQATTNQAGAFRLGPVPTGRYQLTLQRAGYYRLRQTLRLSAGHPTAQFTLAAEHEFHESVRVASHATPMRLAALTHEQRLSARDIRRVPYPTYHDLKQALPALPSVTMGNSGQLHIAGARPGESEYTLDGFDISNPADRTLNARINVDAVRSVRVAAGRYGAQYATAGAGVLALRTGVGDNHLRFGTSNFFPGVSLQQGLRLGNWYPQFEVSGPLRRNRAWFSDAVSLQHTLTLITQLPKGQDSTQFWDGDNLFSAQYQAAHNNLLQANFLLNYNHDSGLGLAAFTPLSVTTNLDGLREFASLRDEITTGGGLFVAGLAEDHGRENQLPQGNQLYVITPGGARGNYFQTLRQTTGRQQAFANYFAGGVSGWGRHHWRLGANWQRITLGQNATRNPFEITGPGGVLLQRSQFLGPGTLQDSDELYGAFAEDRWQLGRSLTVEPALRLDADHLASGMLAEPRIAANYVPFAQGETKLSAGWGIYFNPIDLTTYSYALDQQRQDVFYTQGQASQPYTIRFGLPPAALAIPRFTTTYLGWRQRLPDALYLGMRWLDRRESQGLSYQNLTPASQVNLFQLGNQRQDHYHAWEISLRRSFEHAAIFGDYMRSSATTNQALEYSLASPVLSPQAAGPEPWDAPNRFLSWGWTPAPIWNLLLTWHAEYRTGYPFNVVNQYEQLVGAPGHMRFPNYFSLDLGFVKHFPFHHHEWAIMLDILNITNHRNPDSVINNLSSPNFLAFSGSQGRVFTARLRLLGKH